MGASSKMIGVGVFVIGGILLFAIGLFTIGEKRMLFEDSFHIYTDFAALAGLQEGAKVRVSGLDAGEVTRIEVPPGPASKFRVQVRITERLQPLVRTDSVASIQTDGLVGSKILQVSAGTADAPAAGEETVIPSREPFELSDLIQQIRDTVMVVRDTVDTVQYQLDQAIGAVADTAEQVNSLVGDVGTDIRAISDSGKKIADNMRSVMADIDAGRGTVGKLLKDDQLYRDLSRIAGDTQKTAQNALKASEQVRAFVSDIKSSEIVEETEKTLKNVTELTGQAKEVVSGFTRKDETGSGTQDDVRLTLKYAREAMSNLAEDSEALKRNWFFRGFFKDRGFYNLDDLTVADYRDGALEKKDRKAIRRWLTEADLFSTSQGRERLSDAGKQRLDEVMAEFLRYPLDSALIVEGYAPAASEDEEFLRSRERAIQVRDYLINKFHLDRNYTGFLAIGDDAPNSPTAPTWDGVALALFVHKKAEPRN